MDIHEAPRLRKESDVTLEPGMVVTVEPGIYLPDWGGIRIEDDVLVTPDGCEVLSHVPKSLDSVRIEIESLSRRHALDAGNPPPGVTIGSPAKRRRRGLGVC